MHTNQSYCHCGSDKPFNQCCQPIILSEKKAESPEQLMRSRYSAYVIKNYQYIVDTYAADKRAGLSITEIAEHSENTTWLSLEVLSSKDSIVQFKAIYAINSKAYCLHETSNFILEDHHWRYLDGTIHEDSGAFSIGRNDPCVCGSGKKYKKCCGL